MKRRLFLLLVLPGLNLLVLILTVNGLAGVRIQEGVPPQAAPGDDLSTSATAALIGTNLLFEELQPVGFGGGSWEGGRDELTPAQRQAIQAKIDAAIQQLAAEGKLPPAREGTTLMAWPLQLSGRVADYDYYGISNFVDQNSSFPNQVFDYQCGNRSYDTTSGYNHQGTDIFPWPFSWQKMDRGDVAVVAAAPGIIVYKEDGNYDRSCSFNNNPWNAVFVRHSDGLVTWYGHLKNGSVTGKPVGALVTTGEYLGLVGSSGNSTGPHLHFELHNAAGQLLDPYQGSCNLLNATSWWTVQRPYYDSTVNKVTTGDEPPNFPNCPSPEVSHIQDSFNPGDVVYFAAYYRDQRNGQQSRYTIYRPNGTIYQQWTHQINEPHYAASWWWWSFALGSNVPRGTWRFTVQFNGATYETYFNVGMPPAITVVTPGAGEQWVPGMTHSITWNDNLGGNVRLELWRNGSFFNLIAGSTPSDGLYEWIIPTSIPGDVTYQVRIIDLANEAVYADSAVFALVDPADLHDVELTAPNGGQMWQAGEVVTVTWAANFTEAVRLELSQQGQQKMTIATVAADTGIYTWTVPLNLSSSSDYRVRVTDTVNSNVSDESDAPFTIWNGVENPIWIIYPNGGETWEVGAAETVGWISVMSDSLRLELTRGVTPTAIISTSVPAGGVITWTVPLTTTPANDYLIRAVVAGAGINDTSDAPFTIWDPLKVYLPVVRKP